MTRLAMILVLIFASAVAMAKPEVLSTINQERAANNRAPLAYDARLERAARSHAQDMVRNAFFAHTGSDGSDIGDRLRRAGYPFCFGAENIASGPRSLAEVMASWMASRGHRRNILHRDAEAVGLARASDSLWVLVLGAPC